MTYCCRIEDYAVYRNSFRTRQWSNEKEKTDDEDTKHSEVAPCTKFLRIVHIKSKNSSDKIFRCLAQREFSKPYTACNLSPVHRTMKVLISGSHGLVGSELIKSLTKDGHEVIRLVRHARTVGAPEIEWQPDKGVIDKQQLEGLEAVVHLAGESIASGRWTAEKKRAIRDSRVNGTT